MVRPVSALGAGRGDVTRLEVNASQRLASTMNPRKSSSKFLLSAILSPSPAFFIILVHKFDVNVRFQPLMRRR